MSKTTKQKVERIEQRLKASYEQERQYNKNKALAVIKGNPKYFYSYTQKKLKTQAKIGPLLNKKSELVDDTAVVADSLEEQCSSVYTDPVPERRILNPTEFLKMESRNEEIISDITFSHNNIIVAINDLKSNAAAGLCNIVATLLKKLQANPAHPC